MRVRDTADALDGPSARRAALIDACRAWLDQARAHAEARLLEDPSDGVKIARLLSAAADEVVLAIWDFAWTYVLDSAKATTGDRMALLAVGGYGRGVLAPYSDLDLLFLRPWKDTPASESLTEFTLYALWDLGLKVGHASRTVSETLKAAREDMTVRTAVLEARRLTGDVGLSDELRRRFVKEIIRGSAKAFVAAKLEERDARHVRAGASRYLVEPNVKDGKGGLRDLHTLYWIAQYLDPETPRGERALSTVLTAREQRRFGQTFQFLWAVRCNLHFVSSRADERMSFDVQPEIARRMGWRGRAQESAVERFMRRYFLVANEVGGLTRAFCAKLEADGAKPPSAMSRFLPIGRARRRRLDAPGFMIEGGRLNLASPDLFTREPVAMLRLFSLADSHDLDLHPDAFTAVVRSLSLVTPKLRRDPEASRAFLEVLANGAHTYRILSLMNDAGLLGRFLPEFGRIVGQTQLNRYHAFTVDEHSLRAIGVINDIEHGRMAEDHPLSSALMPSVSEKTALYLAMLLHDTGKGGTRGQEDDGSIAARRACERLGLRRREVELVSWLVRHHLVMSDYAQKRDIADPDTVAAFASMVETPERLRLLLVLTTADIRAVGPGVWNGWKGQLLRELYAATEAAFRGGRSGGISAGFRARLASEAYAAREALVRADPAAVAFVEGMEDAYFVGLPKDEHREHAALATRAMREAGAASSARLRTDRNAAEVAVAARDRDGLFADLCQALATRGANVIGAKVFTSADGLALDVFYLQDASGAPFGEGHPKALHDLQRRLEAAAAGRLEAVRTPGPSPLRRGAGQIETIVAIDNEATEAATIVEVSGRDRQGLLADLARALANAGLSIHSAHVENYGARAVDAFYVLDRNGDKLIDPDQIAALKAAIEAVFAPMQTAARPSQALGGEPAEPLNSELSVHK